MKKIYLTLMMIIFTFIFIGCENNKNMNNINDKLDYVYYKSNIDVKRISTMTNDKINPIIYSLHDMINEALINKENCAIYLMEVNKVAPYFIASYCPDELINDFRFSSNAEVMEKVSWVKYKKLEDVKNVVNEIKLCNLYIVYDLIIKKDIVNGETYNAINKFYQKIYLSEALENTDCLYGDSSYFIYFWHNNHSEFEKDYIYRGFYLDKDYKYLAKTVTLESGIYLVNDFDDISYFYEDLAPYIKIDNDNYKINIDIIATFINGNLN